MRVPIYLVTACNEQNPREQGICEEQAEFTIVNEHCDVANNAVILGDCHCLENTKNGYS